VSIGLMIQSSVPVPPSILNKRLVAFIENLKNFLQCTNWDKVRDNLRALHSHTKKDEIRGSWRFNFGWTEMRVGKARGFDGVPVDSDGMSFPRVASVQHLGGPKAAFVLLTFTRLLNIIFEYFDNSECLDMKGENLTQEIQKQLAPFRFPLQVVGTDLFTHLQLGDSSVVTACCCMSRLSVMMFDSRRVDEKQDKFSSNERVYLHVDKKDLESIQFVVAICFKIPEEAFVTVSIGEKEDNTSFFYWTTLDEDDQDLKLFIYGADFAKVVHGNAVFDKDWADGAPSDAWMIRLSPYGTTHIKRWSEKLKKLKSKDDMFAMLSSFNLMGGSKVLGRGDGDLKRNALPRVEQRN
jgi:hypothetical protein